ncbi:MAG: hypothetical protein DLM55_02600 [Acidimicrobiales bacterium]|nr:MAG: hypothetical protein DLM55_02600 [Acidimicrobiales bacterium]
MDRRAQLFMTPDEFEQLVAQAVQRFNLRAVFDRRYVHLTCHAGGAPEEPGKGIRLQRPRAERQTLYLVQHGIRTHDSDLIKLFDRLRRDWSGFVSRPVRATNIVFGGSESSRDLASLRERSRYTTLDGSGVRRAWQT